MTSVNVHIRFWFVAFALFAAILWLLKPVLLPFLAGMAIAYFLNPVVDDLMQRKVSRPLGALIVLCCFAMIFGLILLLIVPLLEDQVGALINAVPSYIDKARAYFIPWFENVVSRIAPDDVDKIRDAAGDAAGNAAGLAGKAIGNVLTGGFAIIDIFALLIITPVVAFYLLRDWPLVTRAIDDAIPRRHYNVVKAELSEIDVSLSGFVRGQALVCLALGAIYTLGLTVVGLQYGATIGVTAGVLSFIPYVGTIFAFVSSIILDIVQHNGMSHLGFVLGVLIFGQVMEAYVLTPRLVGKRVGLHPVWILFALIAGGRLMGFAGVLIAVPVAAVMGVLTRFALKQYKASGFYEDATAVRPLRHKKDED